MYGKGCGMDVFLQSCPLTARWSKAPVATDFTRRIPRTDRGVHKTSVLVDQIENAISKTRTLLSRSNAISISVHLKIYPIPFFPSHLIAVSDAETPLISSFTMVCLKWIIASALVASTASANIWDAMIPSAVLKREELSLLKRQNLSVGSPLYNCHDNCGKTSASLPTFRPYWRSDKSTQQ